LRYYIKKNPRNKENDGKMTPPEMKIGQLRKVWNFSDVGFISKLSAE